MTKAIEYKKLPLKFCNEKMIILVNDIRTIRYPYGKNKWTLMPASYHTQKLIRGHQGYKYKKVKT